MTSALPDIVTLELVQEYLISTVREMRVTMIRTAHSSVIYEGHDFSCALLDAEGNLVAQSEDSPAHVIPLNWQVRQARSAFEGTLREGDIILVNDIDAFCGAVGTGGMLRGVWRALRDAGSRARVVALEPSSSPALTAGRGGAHGVEGIGTGSVPPHLADRPYDEARAVDEAEGRATARELARVEGLLVGTSSGLNVAAARELARELGPGRTVATVIVNTGLKYLAGDLFER